MERSKLVDLVSWAKKKGRKPLLLRGARQVGKSWLVRELGKQFSSFVEINLEANPEYISIFEKQVGSPLQIIEQLSLVLNQQIIPGRTLLFIDEIQESSDAIVSLRYFYEKLPALHVIAAGSLLEFTLKELSFPVGRLEFMFLFPMSFTEYLIALDRKRWVQAIDKIEQKEIPELVHTEILAELRNYFFLGGLPEVVRTYAEERSFNRCAEIQTQILSAYRADFSKYAKRAQMQHLRKVFDSVPRQFSEKFKYVNVASELKARELGQALDLLTEAGLIYKCRHTSANGPPLGAEASSTKFKCYFLDVGLSLRLLGLFAKDLGSMNFNELVNRGGLSEQFVAQELISATDNNAFPELYYWHRDALNSSAEVDFVISDGAAVLPIEVKAGQARTSKSLGIFMSEKRTQKGILVSSQAFHGSKKPGLTYLPIYAIAAKFGKISKTGPLAD